MQEWIAMGFSIADVVSLESELTDVVVFQIRRGKKKGGPEAGLGENSRRCQQMDVLYVN